MRYCGHDCLTTSTKFSRVFPGFADLSLQLQIPSIAIGRKLAPLPRAIASPAAYDRITAAWRDAERGLLELH